MIGRNFLGQRLRPRRISDEELSVLRSSIEHAMNAGIYGEGRIFWTPDLKNITFAPVKIGDKLRLASE